MTRSQTLYSLRLPRSIGYMVYVMDDGAKVYAGYTHFEDFSEIMRGKSKIFDDRFQRWWSFLNR